MNITTEIIINASQAKVWNTLMDFPAYSDWNPFILSISGEQKAKSQLTVMIQPPGQTEMKFTPYVLRCEEATELRWLGKLFIKGLFDGEHFFRLEAISEQQTKLIHGEYFSGLLSGIIIKMIGKNTRQGFIAMNEALKSRVEKRN